MVSVRYGLVVVFYFAMAMAAVKGFPSLRGFDIKNVEVGRSGQWKSDPRYPNGQYPGQTRAECAKAKVNSGAMMKWFSHAVQLSRPVWMERTEWTQCYSEGSLVSRNRKYYWFLDPSGRGSISTQPDQNGKIIYIAGPSILEPGTFGVDGVDPDE